MHGANVPYGMGVERRLRRRRVSSWQIVQKRIELTKANGDGLVQTSSSYHHHHIGAI